MAITKPTTAAKAASKAPAKTPAKASGKGGGKTKVTKPADKNTKTTKATKAAKPASAFKKGQIVTFVGYGEPQEDPMFVEGQDVHIVDIETREGADILVTISLDDVAAYAEDPEAVTAEELAPSEVKAKGKVPKAEITIRDVGEMSKYMKGDPLKAAKTIVDRVQELQENIDKQYFYLGGLLAHIFHENLFKKDYNYDDFDAFCQGEFSFGMRKARYWINIYMTLSGVKGFTPVALKDIGWSAAAEISRYATSDNFAELIKHAEEKPIAELKPFLKEEYVTESGETPSGRQGTRTAQSIKKVTFSFSLFEDQADGAKLILEAAQKQLGLSDQNQVLEHILNEWAAAHLSTNAAKKAKRASKSKLRSLKEGGVDVSAREEQQAST